MKQLVGSGLVDKLDLGHAVKSSILNSQWPVDVGKVPKIKKQILF
jgi:hypothetical protein